MKRLLILALSLYMVLALIACGTQSNDSVSDSQGTSEPVQSGNTDEPKENEQTDTPTSEAETPDIPGEEGNDVPEGTTGSEVLVAYFSCTGNTKGLAEKIASAMDADIYEIVPEQPYTDDDLNYNDSSTRATVEQNDASARPAISGAIDNMDSYDTIIIGYPIWWGQAPKIIYTFVESYDLSGKTVIPFCTSGSSGVGSSASNLQTAAPDANWTDGTRFSSGASDGDIESWLGGLGLK